MNEIRRCRNKCIFCFVDQMPPGLRPSLYVKDDDFLQSFMHGNFITLTNMTESDVKKIIKHRIEPLYISIHSMDPLLRKILFGTTVHKKALKFLRMLDDSGIRTNIQVVLLPRINDGKDLEKTIDELVIKYKNIDSVGIVPVGITKFNKNPNLVTLDNISAKKTILLLKKLKAIYGEKISKKVFLSDEFYLISKTALPSYRSYGKLLQINNGIGKSADFINDIKKYIKNKTKCLQPGKINRRILLITSEYGAIVLREAIKIIKSSFNMYNVLIYDGISIDVLEIKNLFFGGNVKVTGLLTGSDLKRTIDQVSIKDYSSVLIPGSLFNSGGLTLDGYNEEYITLLGKNIKIIPEGGESLMDEIGDYLFRK